MFDRKLVSFRIPASSSLDFWPKLFSNVCLQKVKVSNFEAILFNIMPKKEFKSPYKILHADNFKQIVQKVTKKMHCKYSNGYVFFFLQTNMNYLHPFSCFVKAIQKNNKGSQFFMFCEFHSINLSNKRVSFFLLMFKCTAMSGSKFVCQSNSLCGWFVRSFVCYCFREIYFENMWDKMKLVLYYISVACEAHICKWSNPVSSGRINGTHTHNQSCISQVWRFEREKKKQCMRIASNM